MLRSSDDEDDDTVVQQQLPQQQQQFPQQFPQAPWTLLRGVWKNVKTVLLCVVYLLIMYFAPSFVRTVISRGSLLSEESAKWGMDGTLLRAVMVARPASTPEPPPLFEAVALTPACVECRDLENEWIHGGWSRDVSAEDAAAAAAAAAAAKRRRRRGDGGDADDDRGEDPDMATACGAVKSAAQSCNNLGDILETFGATETERKRESATEGEGEGEGEEHRQFEALRRRWKAWLYSLRHLRFRNGNNVLSSSV